MTLYSIAPFALTDMPDDGVAIHAPNGLFTIEDRWAADALRALSLHSQIDHETLVETLGGCSDAPALENFLKQGLGLIHEVRPAACAVHLAGDPEDIEPLRSMFLSETLASPSEEREPGLLRIEAINRPNLSDSLAAARAALRPGQILVTLFPFGPETVVTPPWRPGLGIACPCCCMDFLEEARFQGGRRGELSLGDALAALQAEGCDGRPFRRLASRDLAYAGRIAAARSETVLGIRRGWDDWDDVRSLLRISHGMPNITCARVPLSPACDCLHHAPGN